MTHRAIGALSRRNALKMAAASSATAAVGGLVTSLGPARRANAAIPKVRLAWAEVAACHAPIAYGVANGLFLRRDLDVELAFLGLDGRVILEGIASGKVDVGAHLLIDWLKPLQDGLPVQMIAGTHGGCQRILVPRAANITTVADLKGKTIAVPAIGGVTHTAFIVTLARAGLDPARDVTWKVFPFDQLAEAVKAGQADALATLDPSAYSFKKQNDFLEIANTQSGIYQDRLCCAVAARSDFLQANRDTVRRLVETLIEVHEYTAGNPTAVAAFYIERFKPSISQQDLTEVLGGLTYHQHPVGRALVAQTVASIDDLKLVKLLAPDLDSAAFAARITDNILT
jgi:NitT/TauT family transport system substrate-binding protein